MFSNRLHFRSCSLSCRVDVFFVFRRRRKRLFDAFPLLLDSRCVFIRETSLARVVLHSSAEQMLI